MGQESDNKGVGLEIDGGRIHFRIGGMTAPRSMPYADCAGVSLRLAPMVTGLGMNLRYRVDLLDRDFDPAILIGDSGDLIEARNIWRRAAGKLELPAVEATPSTRTRGSAPVLVTAAGVNQMSLSVAWKLKPLIVSVPEPPLPSIS